MKAQNRSQSFLQRWLRPVLVGCCVGVLCGTLLLLLMALAVRSVDVPRAFITPMAIAVAAVAAFVAGLTAALSAGQNGLVLGAVCGLLLFLLLLLAGVARATGVSGQLAVVKLAVLTLTGALGGVLGVNRRRAGGNHRHR